MTQFTTNRVIFADTGAFVGLINKRDQYHIQATRALDQLLDTEFTLVTTTHVLAETITKVRRSSGHRQAVLAGKLMREHEDIEVIVPSTQEMKQAWKIFEKFHDQEFSFVDCISFAVMQERKINESFTFDKHFSIMGFQLL